MDSMSFIKIQPEALRQQSSRFSAAADELSGIYWGTKSLASQLDWEVRCQGNIEAKISEAEKLGQSLQAKASRLADYLNKCATEMEDADLQGQRGVSAIPGLDVSTNVGVGTVLGVGTIASLSVAACNITGIKSAGATALNWIKGIFGWGKSNETVETSVDTATENRNSETDNVEEASDTDWAENVRERLRLADFNSSSYDGGAKFPRETIYGEGQCTWYCFGRAQEKTGKTITFSDSGAAGAWLESVNNCEKSYDPNAITANSIAVSEGHVVFVEEVKDGTVYFSEANWPKDNAISADDGTIKSMNVSDFIQKRNIQGYIYI